MISFIVPAHNEQAQLGRTLQSIHGAAAAVGQPYEVIVVDDASVDATPEIARDNKARVVRVDHRHIAATRNSGARAAQGERLFFVDADTVISPEVVASALRSMDRGAVGGGAPARFDGESALYGRLLMWWLGWFARVAGISGGAFMFCTREAFDAVGGFDERLFAAEDAALSWALKREGRFVVLWQHVYTSPRRLRGFRGPQALLVLVRMAFVPTMLARRSSVERIWYDSNRNEEEQVDDSIAVKAMNAVLLLLMLAVISGPVWAFIPWSWAPRGTVLGHIKVGVAILGCHVGLVTWPCAYFLCRSLLRQKRWLERIKLLVLIAVCLFLAWGATPVVIAFWTALYQRLTHSFSA
jgi:cellulose synthase/poly-beta-1,6-N-acetylglucosamine synthase-like glycosyltransferase